MARKILLVDDEPGILELLANRLKANDYEVITASVGQEGLEKAGKEKPDLMLLDVMMPEMGGLEVLRHLKKVPETRNIPVIMFTVKAGKEDIERAILAGASDYITKPFTPRILLERIKEVCDGKR